MNLIKWTNLAQTDLFDILSYFSRKGEKDIGKIITITVVKTSERLINNPLSGRLGRVDGTREVLVKKFPYILVYRILANNTIEIIRVMHTSRSWPELVIGHK